MKKAYWVIGVLVVITVAGLVTLGYGDPQSNKYIYIFQRYVLERELHWDLDKILARPNKEDVTLKSWFRRGEFGGVLEARGDEIISLQYSKGGYLQSHYYLRKDDYSIRRTFHEDGSPARITIYDYKTGVLLAPPIPVFASYIRLDQRKKYAKEMKLLDSGMERLRIKHGLTP